MIDIKQAWDMYQKTIESSHKLWSYFTTVSLAVIGYVIAWEKIDWSLLMYIFVAVGYGLFAWGNYKAVGIAQNEVEASASLFNSTLPVPAPKPDLINHTFAVNDVKKYYGICCAMVFVVIAYTAYEKCGAQTCPKTSVKAGAEKK